MYKPRNVRTNIITSLRNYWLSDNTLAMNNFLRLVTLKEQENKAHAEFLDILSDIGDYQEKLLRIFEIGEKDV